MLEEALCEFPGCLLVVSHDRWFLDHVATGILAFSGDGQVTFYEGNYSDYQDRLAAQKSAEEEVERPKAAPVAAPAANKCRQSTRKLTYAESIELAGIEEKILTARRGGYQTWAKQVNDPALCIVSAPLPCPALLADLSAPAPRSIACTPAGASSIACPKVGAAFCAFAWGG